MNGNYSKLYQAFIFCYFSLQIDWCFMTFFSKILKNVIFDCLRFGLIMYRTKVSLPKRKDATKSDKRMVYFRQKYEKNLNLYFNCKSLIKWLICAEYCSIIVKIVP